MRTSLIILLNKVITFICKILKKNGTVFPASIVLPMDRKILSKLKYPKYVIGVTGSAGKGTTTALIEHILRKNNYKVVWNKSGSNATNGISTLILNNTNTFTHQVKGDVLLLELDEGYFKHVFRKKTLTHLVVNNIIRDQPARNYTPEIVMDKLKEAIADDLHLIINADDVLVNHLAINHPGEITTFGIAKNSYSLNKPLSNNLDGAYCPLCNTKLKYNYYHYGHLGDFKCPKCDFERIVDYEATNIDLDKCTFEINGTSISLNENIFFNIYSTLAAFVTTCTIGVSKEGIENALNNEMSPRKNVRIAHFDNREINFLVAKNETNLSYHQALTHINNFKGLKTVVMGFNCISRRYDFQDLSWLYDIDFEYLDLKNIDYIYCFGPFRYDIATRLVNANIPEDKLILFENVIDIKKELKKSKGTIFTIIYFDLVKTMINMFPEDVK